MITIVTSVLQYKNKILLVKRSRNVRTYKGKWACISGYLEQNETLLERALKEIHEETHLPLSQINFIKQGEPIEFYDATNKTHWQIHPFLFKTNIDTVTLDWEHDEFKWIEIDELQEFETVPKLSETIKRLI